MVNTKAFELHHRRSDDWFVRHRETYLSELLASKLLFRTRSRLGNLTADQLTPKAQAYLKKIGKIDIIT